MFFKYSPYMSAVEGCPLTVSIAETSVSPFAGRKVGKRTIKVSAHESMCLTGEQTCMSNKVLFFMEQNNETEKVCPNPGEETELCALQKTGKAQRRQRRGHSLAGGTRPDDGLTLQHEEPFRNTTFTPGNDRYPCLQSHCPCPALDFTGLRSSGTY